MAYKGNEKSRHSHYTFFRPKKELAPAVNILTVCVFFSCAFYIPNTTERCLCDKCESKSKSPANDSPEFDVPLLRFGIDEDEAPVEVTATEESRLPALEKTFDERLSVLTKLMEKPPSNSPPDAGTNSGAGF